MKKLITVLIAITLLVIGAVYVLAEMGDLA